MATLAKSFTAVGSSDHKLIRHKSSFTYRVSGTFVGTVILERSLDGGTTWTPIGISATAAASGTYLNETPDGGHALYRWRCTAYTSGTIVTDIVDVPVNAKKRVLGAGPKVGGTAGWTLGAANNVGRLGTVAASQTGAKLVVPINCLKVGDILEGVYLVGQIESAGGAVTVDMEIRKMTSAAADITDATVASMTQLSVTADTIMSETNARKVITNPVPLAVDEFYYVIVTVTTAAATDVDLMSIGFEISEG